MLLATSAPGARPVMLVVPSANAPKSTYRWEMDLSPGTVNWPPNREVGEIVRFVAATVETAYYVSDSARLMTETGHEIRLTFRSTYDLLDLIEQVADRLSEMVGLDEDSAHWVSVAVRESVINAIKHGNKEDASKQVVVRFTLAPQDAPKEYAIEVLDEGAGFDVEEIADPLAPENMLKSSGRGIFFMKSFMDDVRIARRPEGGMMVRLLKKLA